MEATVYNQKGSEVSKIKLPENIFGVAWNPDLVHQVTVSMMANKRAGTANVKDRSDVRGGGKKPWKQKGTGRARHGSSRSPIWSGGGITHGPTSEKIFKQKINKKMKVKALYSVLSEKFRNNEILFVDSIAFDKIKTKDAVSVVNSLGKVEGFSKISTYKKPIATVLIPERNEILKKSFRNLSQIDFSEVRNLNTLEAMNRKYLIFVGPESSLKVLSKTE